MNIINDFSVLNNSLISVLGTIPECNCANVRVKVRNGGALDACNQAEVASSDLPSVMSA